MITVVTPATGTDLTTLETVKTGLGITDDTDDDYLTLLIAQASAAVSGYCRRVFGLETVLETFRLDSSQETLMLGRFPVTAVASIVEDGITLTTDDWERDNSLLYRLTADERQGWSARKVLVTYTAGYVLPGETDRTLPADIEAATIAYIRGLWFAKTRDPLIKSEKTPDVYEVTYGGVSEATGGILSEVESTLCRYRDVSPL